MSGTRPPYPSWITRRSPARMLGLWVAMVLASPPIGTPRAAPSTVYTWTDSGGGVHYADRPPAAGARKLRIEHRSAAPEAGGERSRAHVEKVLDGDTVELRSGKRVRLLGINAPETAKRGKSGEAGGEAARETLRDWIEGRWVTLEVGPEPEDRYGRMLAFVHDDEGRLINAELLRAGLAHSYFFLPRIVHEQALLAAETEARAARRGIWSRAEGRVFSPAALTDAQNRFRQVRGRVSHERADAEFRFVFLDRTLGLRVARTLDFVPRGLTGRTLLARGKIRRIKGALWMDIRHPSQLVLDPPPVQDKGRPSP